MKKSLEESFNGLRLTDRQKHIFENVYVSEINVSTNPNRLNVKMVGDHLVDFFEVINLRSSIEKLLEKLKYKVMIDDRYTLSEAYTAEDFWHEYRDSIYLIIKDISNLDYSILLSSDVRFEGETLYINSEKNEIAKGRIETIGECIKNIFLMKAGFEINVVTKATKETVVSESQPNVVKIERRYKETSENGGKDSNNVSKAGNATASGKGADTGVSDANAEDVDATGTLVKGGPENKKTGKRGSATDKTGKNSEDGKKSAQKTSSDNTSNTGASGAGNDMNKTKASDNNQGSGGFANGSDNKSYFNKFNKFKKKTGRNVDEDCFYGWNCDGEIVKLIDIQTEMDELVINGMVTSIEERELRSGKFLFMFNITDFTDSISAKVFVKPEDIDSVRDNVKKGKFLKVKGIPVYDTYSKEICLNNIHGMKEGVDTRTYREDTYDGMKRVELHAHTQMSETDAVMSVKDYISTAKRWGHTACAITDHGVVQSFPDAEHCLDKNDPFKVIYGVEAYLVDDNIKPVLNDCGQDLQNSYVVFDIETTGIGAKTHKIIEFGAVKVVNGEIKDRYSTFVNPETPIPYNITKLTSITDEDVKDSPTIEKILPEFLEFSKGSILVAHNAGFDYGFVTHYAKELGLDSFFTVVDTVGIARILLPDSTVFNLDSVAKKFGVVNKHHHRAVDDSEATALIFIKMLAELQKIGVKKLSDINVKAGESEENLRKMFPYHAVILAKNETGRVNLYRLISESHLKYYGGRVGRPKMPRSLIEKYREGLILGSACSSGELYSAIVEEKSDEEIDRIVKFYDYLEIQPVG
ncbi:MAG: PHP domain-containing protein, partial [Lachnospiraceae bacterium]|nr:PHP domain-containing protein [Lachnospiraceae bacterium]